MPDKFNPFKADYYGSTSLALAFSWNIWDGGAKMMKTRQNKLQLENLDVQREHIKRQLELSISSSLNSIETAACPAFDGGASAADFYLKTREIKGKTRKSVFYYRLNTGKSISHPLRGPFWENGRKTKTGFVSGRMEKPKNRVLKRSWL